MVERQYEAMKAERMRQLDEPSTAAAKPPAVIAQRPEEQEISSVAPQPTNTASSATDAQPNEHEVVHYIFCIHIVIIQNKIKLRNVRGSIYTQHFISNKRLYVLNVNFNVCGSR